MSDALEIIKNIIAQHSKITEIVKTTGDEMNDLDAVFSLRRATYKTTHAAFSVTTLLEKRDQLVQTTNILEAGLKKHFEYEEKVLPQFFGELPMKNILHDHHDILKHIENVKTCLLILERLNRDELLSKRVELIQSVNNLSEIVLTHAKYEEGVLSMIKKVFEVKRTTGVN